MPDTGPVRAWCSPRRRWHYARHSYELPAQLRPVVSIIAAADLGGTWWSNGAATIYLRRVTRPVLRTVIAAIGVLVGLAAIVCAPLLVGPSIPRVILFTLLAVPVVATSTFTAVETIRAQRFTHRLDTYATNWTRLDTAAPGAGVELLRQINQLETRVGRTIGGTARNATVRSLHLAAGRQLDDPADADGMRTVAVPGHRAGQSQPMA